MTKWGGRKAQAWSAAVLARYGTECWLRLPGCLGTATTGDHVLPRSKYPDHQYVVANGRPACQPCNSTRNNAPAPGRDVIDATNFFERPPTSPEGTRPSPPQGGEKPAGPVTVRRREDDR